MAMATRPAKGKLPTKGVSSNVEIGIPGFAPTYKSLYLDTLTRQDLAGNPSQKPRLAKRHTNDTAASPSLTTADIDAAYPQRLHKNLNFGDYAQDTLPKTFKDEPGMRPRQRITESRNRPNFALMVDDIPGSQPKYRERKMRARSTDPLQPRYQISKVTNDLADTVISHSALHNPLDVSDIEGAQPKKRDVSAPRSTRLDVHDIDGASPGWQPAHRDSMGKHTREAWERTSGLNVMDINTYMQTKPSKENMEVLPPKGHPDGPHKPTPIKPRKDTSIMDNSLRTADVEGVRLMFKRDNDPFVNKFKRRQYRKINDVSDIPGATPVHPHEEYQRLHKQKLAESSDRHKAHLQAQKVLEDIKFNRDTLERTWTALKQTDKDKAGLIDGVKFKKVLQDSGATVSPEQADVLVAGLSDNAGFLNYRMFAKVMLKKVAAEDDLAAAPSSKPPKSASRGRQPWCSDTRVQSPSPSRPSSAHPSTSSFTATPRQRPSSAPPSRAPRSRSATPRATTPTRSSTPAHGKGTSSPGRGLSQDNGRTAAAGNSPAAHSASPHSKTSSTPGSSQQCSPHTQSPSAQQGKPAGQPASPAAAVDSPAVRQRSPSPSRSPIVGAPGSSPFSDARLPGSQPQSPVASSPTAGKQNHNQQPSSPLKSQVSPQVSGSLPQSPATTSTYHDATEQISPATQPSPPASPVVSRSPTKAVTIAEPASPHAQPKSPAAIKAQPGSPAAADRAVTDNVAAKIEAQQVVADAPVPSAMPPTMPHPPSAPSPAIPTTSTSSDVSTYVDQPRRQVWTVDSPSSATSSAAVTVAAGIARGVDSPIINDGDLVPALNVRTAPTAVHADPVVQEEWWPDAVAAPLCNVQDEEPPTPSQGGHTTECEDEPASSTRLSPLPAHRVLEELETSHSQPNTARQQPQSPVKSNALMQQKLRQALDEELADQAKSLEQIRMSLKKAEHMQANLVKPTTRKEDGEVFLRMVSGKDEREQRDQMGWQSSLSNEASSWAGYTAPVPSSSAAAGDSTSFWHAGRHTAPASGASAYASFGNRDAASGLSLPASTSQRQPSTTATADMPVAGSPTRRPATVQGDHPMGFGNGGWPPEPVPYRPQRRPQAAIVESTRASNQTAGNVNQTSRVGVASTSNRKKRVGIKARLAAMGRGLRALMPSCSARTVDDASESD